MYTYKATNYGMGRPTATVTFQAGGDFEARAIAERKLPGKNAMAGRKGQVIGLKVIK